MCLQDPPVTIETEEPGNKFDTEKYKAYTKKGQFIDYVAWPPVRLYEGGPFLGKGIAQGTNKTKNTWEKTKNTARGAIAPSATHPKGGTECADIFPAKTMLENEPVRTLDPESVSARQSNRRPNNTAFENTKQEEGTSLLLY